MAFFQIPQFPPVFLIGRLIDYTELPLSVNECMNVGVNVFSDETVSSLGWIFPPITQCFTQKNGSENKYSVNEKYISTVILKQGTIICLNKAK